MKNKKINKILIISICILLIFTAVINSVLALNVCHKEHCLMVECPICMMIENAINFINNLAIIMICMILLGIIVPLKYLMEHTISCLTKKTLVECNVQHNE